MFDPLELSKKTEQIVVKETAKKYYRFRPTKFYGGIATADTVGCNLRCMFCWSDRSVWNAAQTGTFYSPEQVTEELSTIAQRKQYTQVRISGGEPTIGRNHLLAVLERIPSHLNFILETNGILLGADSTYVNQLSSFKNLHVRVCLKGIDEKEFSWFTGASTGFQYQINALEYLRDAHLQFNIAVVSLQKDRTALYNKLSEMGLDKVMLEEEEIVLYPQVRQRLEQQNLLRYFSLENPI